MRGRPRGGIDNEPLSEYRVTIHVHVARQMSRARASADVFRAIGDPTRRAILDRLRAGPANAGALAADFRQTRPAISKHVRVLREARLVSESRSGRERYYELNPAPLQALAGWVAGYRSFWESGLALLKRNLEGTS